MIVEILLYNYWEHFKSAKEFSRIYSPTHPKMIALQNSIDELLEKINKTRKPEK